MDEHYCQPHDMFRPCYFCGEEMVSRCPACGDAIDYCQGHGAIGDPVGHAILTAHDADDHGGCEPAGCEHAMA